MGERLTLRKILLTGASGFAGAHMLKRLLADKQNFVYCPVTYSHGGRRERIDDLIKDEFVSRYKLFIADLAQEQLDLDDLEIDCIVNFASESHVDNSILHPANLVGNNVNLLINILESLKHSKRRIPIFHISTDEVYGEVAQGKEIREWASIPLPSNPYSASKAMQENLVVAYWRTFGILSCLFNITNMIGEAQNPEKFLPRAISRVLARQEINVDTNQAGELGSRKYVYVGDVAEAIMYVLKLMFDGNIDLEYRVEKFHISGGVEYSNLEIVNLVGETLGITPLCSINPSPRRGYDLRYDLNSDKIRKLGWSESKAVPEIIRETVNWTVERPHWLE